MSSPFILENAHLRMCVDPQGGAVQQLFSLTCQRPVLKDPSGTSALFPMLPLANRVAENRFSLHGRTIALPDSPRDSDFFLHGDGWLKAWQVSSCNLTECVMTLDSRDDCGFDYQATLHYQLADNVFHARLTLTHCAQAPMLYGLGFHPWFYFDAGSTAQFNASGYWPEGEQHLPLAWQETLPGHVDFSGGQYGRDEWLNVCYSGWSGGAKVRNDEMEITLLSQTPWLMLFRMSGQSFLCLEPQSHPVNAHRMPGQPGLVELRQGEETRLAMAIVVHSVADLC